MTPTLKDENCFCFTQRKTIHIDIRNQMTTQIFTVDAFANEIFGGNPAAVCTGFKNVLHSNELDTLFQKIAKEMNLSDTAFITKSRNSDSSNRFFLQWFTPRNEVDLCGHATLATAHILFERFIEDSTIDEIIFETKNAGELKAKRSIEKNLIELNFPAGRPEQIEFEEDFLEKLRSNLKISTSIQIKSIQLCRRTKYLLLHLSEIDPHIQVDFSLLKLNFPDDIRPFVRGIIVTSESDRYDFVSRFFSPWFGVLEDPVTGSAHTVLTMYWLPKINPSSGILHAFQSSERGGEVWCYFDATDDRVFLRGSAVTVIEGSFRYSNSRES